MGGGGGGGGGGAATSRHPPTRQTGGMWQYRMREPSKLSNVVHLQRFLLYSINLEKPPRSVPELPEVLALCDLLRCDLPGRRREAIQHLLRDLLRVHTLRLQDRLRMEDQAYYEVEGKKDCRAGEVPSLKREAQPGPQAISRPKFESHAAAALFSLFTFGRSNHHSMTKGGQLHKHFLAAWVCFFFFLGGGGGWQSRLSVILCNDFKTPRPPCPIQSGANPAS